MKTEQTSNLAKALLDEINAEFKTAQDDLTAVIAERDSTIEKVNDQSRLVVQELLDAQADHRVVQRLESRLPKRDYDQRLRPVQKRLDEAKAAHAAAAEEAQKKLAPYSHRIQAAQKRVLDLEDEVKAHSRFAKLLG